MCSRAHIKVTSRYVNPLKNILQKIYHFFLSVGWRRSGYIRFRRVNPIKIPLSLKSSPLDPPGFTLFRAGYQLIHPHTRISWFDRFDFEARKQLSQRDETRFVRRSMSCDRGWRVVQLRAVELGKTRKKKRENGRKREKRKIGKREGEREEKKISGTKEKKKGWKREKQRKRERERKIEGEFNRYRITDWARRAWKLRACGGQSFPGSPNPLNFADSTAKLIGSFENVRCEISRYICGIDNEFDATISSPCLFFRLLFQDIYSFLKFFVEIISYISNFVYFIIEFHFFFFILISLLVGIYFDDEDKEELL